ncbi:MAG TPA: ABC transporter permease, partial [Epulopiscium sp.]|nr:ABC transporter permease [Candidatus Epulonipiscium sp.]
MNEKNKSLEYQRYLQLKKSKKQFILFSQVFLLILFMVSWEVLAHLGILNTFLVSRPSAIYHLFIDYISDGSLFKHIGISVWETLLGFSIGTFLGIIIAIILWWSDTIAQMLDP